MSGRAMAGIVMAPVVAVVAFVVVLGTGDTPAQAAAGNGCVISGAATGSSPAASPASAAAWTSSSSGSAANPVSVGSVNLTGEQVGNARTIIGVVKGRSLPQQGAVIALATAYVESTLHNLNGGDRDSAGLFQQRPSMGWGTFAQVTDPVYATSKFLDRMVQVPNWQTADPGVVAQTVQISGVPDAYDNKGMPVAVPLAGALWNGTAAVGGASVQCAPQGPAAGPASAKVQAVLDRAKAALGLPYCFAGGNAAGPTHGSGGGPGCEGNTVGYDCSGLTLYAWAASGVTLPHFAASQAQLGTRVPLPQLQPGDLIFLANNSDGIHHVAMVWSMNADGTGQIIEAQDFGVPVHIRPFKGPAEPEIVDYGVRLAT